MNSLAYLQPLSQKAQKALNFVAGGPHIRKVSAAAVWQFPSNKLSRTEGFGDCSRKGVEAYIQRQQAACDFAIRYILPAQFVHSRKAFVPFMIISGGCALSATYSAGARACLIACFLAVAGRRAEAVAQLRRHAGEVYFFFYSSEMAACTGAAFLLGVHILLRSCVNM